MDSGIYKIINIAKDKIYIGSAIDLKSRKWLHWNSLKNNIHHNSYLQNSWNKYGEYCFIFNVLEYCSENKLIEREQYWIDLTNCCDPKIGYNILKKARSPIGYKHTEEAKLKLSLAHKGKPKSEEHKRKIGLLRIGTKHTEEAKAKMRKTREFISEETRSKMCKSSHKRRSDLWPHSDGRRCKCKECATKRYERYVYR